MKWKSFGTTCVVLLLAALAFGQAAEQYLDVYIADVKPEKRADFDALNKKMVTANRQNKGDTWIAMETAYGRTNRVMFVSTRNSYADADAGSNAFMGALEKAYGKSALDKIFQDFNQCLSGARTELRLRRWDLSSNAPTDPAAMAKLVGEARWVRTVTVHVRSGQVAAFEALLKELKAAREKASPPLTALVSQAVAGQEGTVFYVTILQPSMGGFDTMPTTQQLLGDEGYAKFLKTNAEVVERADTAIYHFLPELSNPPEATVAAAPDYWKPSAVMTAKAKAKTNETAKAAKPAESKPDQKK